MLERIQTAAGVVVFGAIVWFFFFMDNAHRSWDRIQENPSIEACRDYIERWPESKHLSSAKFKLGELLREAWSRLAEDAAKVSSRDVPALEKGARLPGKAVVLSPKGSVWEEETKKLPDALRARDPDEVRVVLLYSRGSVGKSVSDYTIRKGGQRIPGYRGQAELVAIDTGSGICLGRWTVTVSPPYSTTVGKRGYELTVSRIVGNTKPATHALLSSLTGP